MTEEETIRCLNGATVRLYMLGTHYLKPLNFIKDDLDKAAIELETWVIIAERNDDDPPAELIEALKDNLNTPQAITLMRRYAKERNGRALFSSMRFLGILFS